MPRRSADFGSEIRSFKIDFPEEQIADLRRRVSATRWPEREQVPDTTQGVQLATMQKPHAPLGERL